MERDAEKKVPSTPSVQVTKEGHDEEEGGLDDIWERWESCCGGADDHTPEERQQLRKEKREEKAWIEQTIAQRAHEAQHNAKNYLNPENVSMWAPAKEIGCKFGVGMGLYFQMLEWLMIVFSCVTFLSFPFWIVINQSVFTNEANKDRDSVGLKVFEEPSLLATTFASIPDRQLDPNNTLVYMNTELGDTWYQEEKDDFLLWISLLDLVGVVLTICLVTFFTWKAGNFEEEVDKDTYDLTDYAILVTGLPPDAGFHEVGDFFTDLVSHMDPPGKVIDVELVLDMGRVLKNCARAAKLESQREQLVSTKQRQPKQSGSETQQQIDQIDCELLNLLKDIDGDMDRTKSAREHPLSGSEFLRHPSNIFRPEKWESEFKHRHNPAGAADAETGQPQPEPSLQAEGKEVGLGKDSPEESPRDGHTGKEYRKKAVYDTKAAFVTFNRIKEAKECLKHTAKPGWTGWLYKHLVAPKAQRMRKVYTIETVRARSPSDYIFENMCYSDVLRFWHKFGIRVLYLVMLIACALIVSGLSSRTRTNLNRTELEFSNDAMSKDIGRAASYLPQSTTANSTVSQLRGFYEEAMQEATSTFNPVFSPELASKANFTDYCELALPNVCAEHYRQSLGGAQAVELNMTYGKQFQWGKDFDKLVYERPLLNSLNDLAETTDPSSVKGTDVGLSACLACYCLGLSAEAKYEQQTGDWLLVSKQHCDPYNSENDEAGTEAGISVVIAVLNILLKFFVQILSSKEKYWTRSQMEKSFCVVAYTSQLLNSVLVVLLVNARPNGRPTKTGDRVGANDIEWLSYIILGGSFDDFSAAWYQYVGTSFMILLFIQTVFPLVNICIDCTLKGVQHMMVWIKGVNATQLEYNTAYKPPPFLLQQRVADVMFNVSVALLFYSGMPLCAGVVVLVFAVASLMDRWAITHLSTVSAYGSELPRLILSLLPWMVLLHCGFGLWQHSYFMMENWDSAATSVFVETGKDQLEHDIPPEEAFGEYIDERNVEIRISQPNSFGLLLLAFIMFLWLLFRNMIFWLEAPLRLWIDGLLLENERKGGNDVNGQLRALRRMFTWKRLMPGMQDQDDDVITFEEAICEQPLSGGEGKEMQSLSGSSRKLRGLPTFRLPFNPRYADTFCGLLDSAIWSKMLGPDRYTHLVPVREEVPLRSYYVEMKTSDDYGAGTDSNIFLQIVGHKDVHVPEFDGNGNVRRTHIERRREVSTGWHEFDPDIGNNFETGALDDGWMILPDVGEIKHIEVRSSGSGLGSAWRLAFVKITLRDRDQRVTLEFPCHRWHTPKEPDSLSQVLWPEQKCDVSGKHKAIHVANEGDVTLEVDGTEGTRTTDTLPIVEGDARTDDIGKGVGLTQDRSGDKGNNLEEQRQEVQIKVSWMISGNLIKHVKDAPLDEVYDYKEFGYGPELSNYLAYMHAQVSEEAHGTESSSRS